MKETIRRILQLQRRYTPENNEEMQERGVLVRDELRTEIAALSDPISDALGTFGDDLLIEASDGTGRKSELPWVRFCSRRMSPGPREGYCGVLYFSTDGAAAQVTIGCGASTCVNGSFFPLPSDELQRKTTWAQGIVMGARN